MNRIAINIGFLQIYWYSIFIFLGIIAATFVIYLEAKKKKIDIEFLTNLIFDTVIIGIIGARIYYVIFNWEYYSNNLLEIFQIWNGGLAIHGGIIAGTIFLMFYCHKYKVNIITMLDIVVVGLILAQAIGRWGNFFNGEAYGQITTLENLEALKIPTFIINGMLINGQYYEPMFLYESIFNLIGFILLIIIRHYPYTKKGQLTGLYLIWYSILRLIIESRRSDSLMLGNIKMAQLVSIIFLLIGIFLFIYYKVIKRSSKFENLYKEIIPENKEEEKRQLFIKQN